MKKILPVLLALALSACATSGGKKNTGRYSGPPEWEGRIRSEMTRQLKIIGKPGEWSRKANISAYRCAPTGKTRDGDYTCSQECSKVKECVHAWNQSSPNSWNTAFMFAGNPTDETVAHEVCHFILIHFGGEYGHPQTATIEGKRYNVRRDFLSGARWPSIVRGLKFWDDWQPGDTLGDATLDHTGAVRFVEPVPEKLTDGAGI